MPGTPTSVDRPTARPARPWLLVRYTSVAAALLLVGGLRLALDPGIGPRADLLLFAPVLLTGTWLAGLGPGLAGMVLVAVIEAAALRWPLGRPEAAAALDQLVAGLNVAGASVTVGLTDLARRAVRARALSAAKLRDSEGRLRLALGAADLGTWDVEVATGRVTSSERMAEILGLDPAAEVTAQQWRERVHPEDLERVRGEFAAALGGLREYDCEHRIVRPDGEVRWVAGRATIVRDAEGRPVRAVGVAADITERRRAEESLRRSEERFRLALGGGMVVAYEQDADLRYTWLYPHRPVFQPDVIGKTDKELTGEAHGEELTLLKRGVLTTGQPARREIKVELRSGVRWYDVLVEPRRDAAGNVVGVGGAALDITDRRQAEEGRLASEARLDMALQAGRMGAWEWDIGEGRIAWSPTLQAIHGLAPGTFGGTFEDFQRDMEPEDRPRVLSEIRRALEEGGEYHLTYRITKPDGRRAWVEARAVVVRAADGRPVRMVGVCADVTERALAEAALRESEARFRAAAEGSRDSFFILKAARGAAGEIEDFEFVDMNARGSELIGIPRGRAIGGRLCELLPGNRDGFLEKYRRVVATGETLEEEFRGCAAGHGERWYWQQVVPLGDGIAITTADITQRKEAELNLERLVAQRTRELEETHARMRASERMAALGTLSAGLGHDMGNLLLPVRARLDAIERLALPPGLAEDIGAIRKSAEYLQRLSSGLRLLALDPEDSTATADTTALREWCADSTPVLKNILPRHVTLECDVPAGLPPARVPRHVLTQIVFNLVQNAGDAMRDRRAGRVRIHAAAGPAGLELSISDDGPGMSAEVRRHCLEPFFTTKPRGISTGLGLALVNSAVQRMGGTIRIETALGKGTTFVLGLPAGPEAANGRRPTAVVGIADPRMRSFVGTLLRSLSLDVVEQKGPGINGAALWVTDTAGDLAAAAASPGWGDGERRVIVLDEAPEGAGVTVLGASPAPARLRQALSEAALACAGEPGTGGARRGG